MADDAAGRRIPFAFLEDIHGKFVKTYGRAALTALAYAMNDEFSRVLSQQMDYYSNDPSADQINRMRGEISQVRSVMIDNIDKVLERGDRLDLLVDKTTTMQGNTVRFKRQARRYRSTTWWRNVKLTALSATKTGLYVLQYLLVQSIAKAALILLLLVIVYIALFFVCHGFTLPTCIREEGEGPEPAIYSVIVTPWIVKTPFGT
uniref:Vesicle-associated membrane protein 713 n=1 Tax=Aegilops tauschii TaxID=37682 RepID=N1QZJ4_AEGTA